MQDCAAYLVTLVEPSLAGNPKRLRALVAVVAMQGYTRAEMLLAMKRLPVTNAYGMGFRPDVLDEVVQKNRAVRRIAADPADGVPRLLTQRQMFKACEEHPDFFRSDDFGIATYDPDDRPLYRYARRSGPHVHAPRPEIDESPRPVRTDTGSGTLMLADVVGDGAAWDGASWDDAQRNTDIRTAPYF